MSGVWCVLSWHVLSEGQVHYQRGHTSLECVECRVCWARMSCQKDKSTTSMDTRVYSVLSVVCVEMTCLVRRTSPLSAWTHESRVCWMCVCWAGMSCLKDGSCTSHRSVTAYSWSCIPGENPLGSCSPLCWSSSVLHVSSTPNLSYRPLNIMPVFTSVASLTLDLQKMTVFEMLPLHIDIGPITADFTINYSTILLKR